MFCFFQYVFSHISLWCIGTPKYIPSGKRWQKTMKNHQASTVLMDKSTISMASFNSYLTDYQAGFFSWTPKWNPFDGWSSLGNPGNPGAAFFPRSLRLNLGWILNISDMYHLDIADIRRLHPFTSIIQLYPTISNLIAVNPPWNPHEMVSEPWTLQEQTLQAPRGRSSSRSSAVSQETTETTAAIRGDLKPWPWGYVRWFHGRYWSYTHMYIPGFVDIYLGLCMFMVDIGIFVFLF